MELSNSSSSLTRMDKDNTMNPSWDSANFNEKFKNYIDPEKDVSWVERTGSPTSEMKKSGSWGQFVDLQQDEAKSNGQYR